MTRKIFSTLDIDQAVTFLQEKGLSVTTTNLVGYLKIPRTVVSPLLDSWLKGKDTNITVNMTTLKKTKTELILSPEDITIQLEVDSFANLFRARYASKYDHTYFINSLPKKQRRQIKHILLFLKKKQLTSMEYLHWMFDIKLAKWNSTVSIGFLEHGSVLQEFIRWADYQKATVPDWAKEKHTKEASKCY